MKITTKSEGDPYPSNKISLIVPIILFTNLASIHKFVINMICNPFVNNSSALSPFTMSELALLTSYPLVCTAYILVINWFNDQSISILILSTSNYVIRIKIESENQSHFIQLSFSLN